MSYFKPYIDHQGIHVPEYVDIRNHLVGEFRRIFGSDLYLGEDSQDYQMISLFADAYDDVLALAVDNYNNRNPDYARGRSLDLILPMNGIRRIGASYSTVTLELSGLEGTVVRSGSIAIDRSGNRWQTLADATIGSDGKGSVAARAEKIGEIRAMPGGINQIGTPTSGWASVTNLVEAAPGRNVESDAEVRARRAASVEKSAVGVVPALRGALHEIMGVTRVAVYENKEDESDERGISGHSVAVVIEGGDEDEIAKIVYDKKSPGCGLYGDIVKTVIDANDYPVDVRFARPIENRVSVEITLKILTGFTDEIEAAIKEAVAYYVSHLKIGETLQTGLLYGVVIEHNPKESAAAFAPVLVVAGKDVPLSGAAVVAAYNEVFICEPDDITVIRT